VGVTVQVAKDDIRWNLELRGEKQVQKGLNDTGTAAERAGDALEEMGDQAETAGKQSDKAGGKFKDTADDLGHLERKLQDATKRYRELLTEFNKTGDESLLKDAGKAKREVGKFTRLSGDLVPDVGPEVATAGVGLGRTLAMNIAKGVESGNPYVAGAILGIGGSALPLLGASISAAVLGGVGTGGIIGGIMLASQDPRVSSVAESVGSQLTKEFQGAARSFVDPLIRSLAKIGNAGWADKLAPAFDKLSTYVEPLADGLIGLADKALPGLMAAFDAAGPILDLVAKELPEVGQAISDMLRVISEDPQGAQDALQFLFNLLEIVILDAGYLIRALSEIYEAFVDVAEAVGLVERAQFPEHMERGTGAINEFTDAADAAEAAIKALDQATRQLLDKAFGLEEAQDNAANGFARLTEQIKQQREEHVKGAGSLEGNTQAARDNREAMRNLTDQYREIILEAQKTGAKTDGLREKFLNNAVAAGIARKEAERFANALFGIPTKINVSIAATIKAHGDMVAWSTLRNAERKAEADNAAGRRASGGPVSGGKTYWVGENGPELVTFGDNGYVHNAAASRAMTSGASGGMSMISAGGGTVNLVVTVRGDGPVTQALAENMRFEVRTTANGSAEEYFGTGGG
jgi:ABC-type transporter Mla subunit MlaD